MRLPASGDVCCSTGTTEKHCNDPRKDGGMTAGKVQQIGGFCPFVLALASNYQSPDKQSDESMKSTLAISNPCTPGNVLETCSLSGML